MFIGDFNSILGAHEKLGGRLPLPLACIEFSRWTSLHSLIHLDTSGAKYTWVNKREGVHLLLKDWIDLYAMNNGLTTGTPLLATL